MEVQYGIRALGVFAMHEGLGASCPVAPRKVLELCALLSCCGAGGTGRDRGEARGASVRLRVQPGLELMDDAALRTNT